jgi:hypothetical protein
MGRSIDRPVFDLGAGRVLAKEVVTPPVRRGADRPQHETAAAVGTDIAQQFFNARCAERALEAADARLE